MLVDFQFNDHTFAEFFEETLKRYNNPKIVANWLLGEVMAYLKANKVEIEKANITPIKLAEMLELIENGTISGKIAKTVLAEILNTGKSVQDIIKEQGLTQISDEGEIVKIVQEVIQNNPKQVEQFKAGKDAVIMFLVGQVMKLSKGRAKPDAVQKILREELSQ